MEIEDVEQSPLRYPQIVCTAAKCTEHLNFQGQQKIFYKTRCVEQCYNQSGIQLNHVGHPLLMEAMGGVLTCARCYCPWQVHTLINVDHRKVKRTINVTPNDIYAIDVQIKQIEAKLVPLKKTVREYELERKIIQDVCSKFAQTLISNSNTVN